MSDPLDTDAPPASDAVRVVNGSPTAAEAAAAIAVVRAAVDEELREREKLRLNETDDWNTSQRSLRAAGPFGGVHRRSVR